MTSWRPCPFVAGRRYVVRRAATAPRGAFRAGEVLTFVRDAHSAYHGMTGYVFHDATGADRVFDVADDEAGDEWQRLFGPVPATEA